MAPTRPSLISVDWGTSSFRALFADDRGAVLDHAETGRGILSVAAGGHERVLAEAVGAWRAQGAPPIVMSGMIGSRQGWVEAPYAACPAGIEQLAAATIEIATETLGPVLLVPGLSAVDSRGAPDVMRGEETQIFGALARTGESDALFVLPGTHSKWARVEAGRIVSFVTYMTGEVFAVLKSHSILGRGMAESDGSGDGFERGVDAAANIGRPGDLLHALFMTRTLGLFEQLKPAQAADYLSGLLIGAELAAAAREAKAAIVIASAGLTERYCRAGARLGVALTPAPDHCALWGQIALLAARKKAAA